MCENPDKIIKIEEKTDKAKYEFLRTYYPTWNFITKSSPRVIVDTHAGTGIVEYTETKNQIYGSALLAIRSTLNISKNLTIILNEKSKKNYNILKEKVNEILSKGFPIFKIKARTQYKTNLQNKRKKRIKRKEEYKYPDSPNTPVPEKYRKISKETHANIVLHQSPIEDCIDEIFATYFQPITKTNRKGEKITQNVKGIFLVDPCGKVPWELIKKIGEKNQELGGIELILNWSAQSIYRNRNPKHLKEIFGTQMNTQKSIQEYLELYVNQLKEYWTFIQRVKVPLSLRVKVRRKEVESTYYLLYCSNNTSGESIASGKMEKIETSLKGFNYHSMKEFF